MTIVCAVILLGCTSVLHADAQPKALGTSYSFGGVSLSYEHMLSEDSYAEFAVKGEMSEMFMGKTEIPGISASFIWNMNIKEWSSRNGSEIGLFAGPGVVAGWAKDYEKPSGAFFGLKGRIGAECSFSRNIMISISVSPVIGVHAVLLDDSIRMAYYRYGLYGTLLPEIGIKYRFGK